MSEYRLSEVLALDLRPDSHIERTGFVITGGSIVLGLRLDKPITNGKQRIIRIRFTLLVIRRLDRLNLTALRVIQWILATRLSSPSVTHSDPRDIPSKLCRIRGCLRGIDSRLFGMTIPLADSISDLRKQ